MGHLRAAVATSLRLSHGHVKVGWKGQKVAEEQPSCCLTHTSTDTATSGNRTGHFHVLPTEMTYQPPRLYFKLFERAWHWL